MTEGQSASHTELIDSLLHSDKVRVLKGIVSGLAAGFVMLVLTLAIIPEGLNKFWWLRLAASVVYGGEAARFEGASSILATGAFLHFALSAFLGLIYGKITQSKSLGRLLAYGLVLGGLCWLSSNMFAPDILNIDALAFVGQWLRMFLFQSFALSLSLFMYILVRA